MNHIIIMGRLTADPELKNFDDGSEHCNFTVAAERGYKLKDGTRPADFINCKATKGLAATICKFFNKGDGILVEGILESRKYTDKDNVNHTIWEINTSSISFPVGKKNSSDSNVAESSLPEATEPVFTEESGGELPF